MMPETGFNMIDEGDIDEILKSAYRLLRTEGVRIESEEVRDLLGSFQGVRVELKSGRVKIPTALVKKTLRSARLWNREVHGRKGERKLVLKNGVYFNPGSCAGRILDYEAGVRQGNTEDLARFCTVADYLDDIDAQSTAFIAHDVPGEVQDAYRLFVVLMCSSKPIITGTFGREGFGPMVEMLAVVRGSRRKLARKPLAIFDCAPSAPLKWSGFLAEDVVNCARLGIPVEFVSMPVPGTLAPVYLHDALVQHTAETLSGIVISQCAREGAPVIYGGSPMTWDFRETHCIASPDVMKLNAAYARIGRRLKLATHGYLGLSDANFVDYQAGAETLFGILVAMQAGINVVSGPGMIGQEGVQSIEKLVLDDELCRRARHFYRGMRMREYDPELWAALIHGNIMEHESTLLDFREELLLPRVMSGAAGAAEDAGAAAHREVERILAQHRPAPLDESIRREVCRIMQTHAKQYGMDKLPNLPLC